MAWSDYVEPGTEPPDYDPEQLRLWLATHGRQPGLLGVSEVQPTLWDPNNPVGTESLLSVGMPKPTSYAGPISEFIDPATGRMTARGQARMDDNPAMNFDTGGTNLVGSIRRMTGGRAAARLAPEVPVFSAEAAPYIREGEALPPWAPAAPPTPAGAPLPRLDPGLLYDPAKGVEGARGSTLGMTPEAWDEYLAARRGLMDEGVAGLNRVAPTGERGNASLPNLRVMTPEEAAATAKKDPHLAFKRPDDNYVGAPPDTTNRRQLLALRKAFDAQVARGEGGSDWYDRVNAYIHELSGGDPIKARQIAEEWAVMSAQADPKSNTGFALTARNAAAVDTPAEIARTGQQARTFNEARAAQEEYLATENFPGRNSNPADPAEALAARYFPHMRLGKKTDIYRQHMDPTAAVGVTGTNDIWHGRAFGFVDPEGNEWSKAFGPAQHTWLDYETLQAVNRANKLKLGGRDNWTAAEIQAAPWVAGKAEGLQKRYNISVEEANKRANATYPDVTGQYIAEMPGERVPGVSTGYTTGNMTPEEWHAAMTRLNPGGTDTQLDQLGLLGRKTQTGYGGWQEKVGAPIESNPVDVARPLVDRVRASKRERPVVNPATMTALDMAAHVRGINDFQFGSPVTYWDRSAPKSMQTSITMDLGGRTTTETEARALTALGRQHGLTFANTGDGAGFLNFDEKATGADVAALLKKQLAKEIRQIVPDAKVGRAYAGGDNAKYADYSGKLEIEHAGQGRATRHLDERLQAGRPVARTAYEKLLDDPNEARRSQMTLDLLRRTGQLGVRPDYELWHRLIAEGRLRQALEWARANQYRGLPAAAGGAGLGAGLLGEGGSNGAGS